MVSQKIKDISQKGLKMAKGVMATLELLGLDEDDLLLLKEIPAMREEIASLKEQCSKLRKEVSGEQSKAARGKTPAEQLTEMFSEPVEEFNPYGKQ